MTIHDQTPDATTSPTINRIFPGGRDGAHRGLSDWYDTGEKALVEALARGPGYAWTTGWYSSKHEIASANITSDGEDRLHIEVSVSDDFDTVGQASREIAWTDDLDKIRSEITSTWENAEENQRDNRVYIFFSVGRENRWEETIVLPVGDGHLYEQPPGDNYHQWGWQEEPSSVPDDVRAKLLAWAEAWDGSETNFTVGEWRIRARED